MKWTLENLQKEALKYNSPGDFCKGSPNAYNSARSRNLLDQICSHMTRKNRKPYKLEDLRQIALKYDRRGKFGDLDGPAYGAALKMGVLDEICSHMLPPACVPYTVEKIQKEALKFKTRQEFHKGSTAYKAAWKRGILDQVCSHMPKHVDQSGENNGNFKWKNEEIYEVALKYKTRTDFKLGNPKVYDAAVRRGITDLVCSHMKRGANSSKGELELLAIIKEFYPTAGPHRKRDAKIKGKPHMKGFYLDIFVPELNKGIEFDGGWYHDFEGLKRSRASKGWTDEEIANYHRYKDEHYSSKGIKILHVDGDRWGTEKDLIVKECLEFLSSQ